MEAGESGGLKAAAKSSPFAEGAGPAAIYLLFRSAAWIAEHLPLRVGDVIARGAGDVWYRLAFRKRAMVRANLARVERPEQLANTVREAFRSYAHYWLETFRLGRYSKRDLLEMVVPDHGSAEAMQAALDSGRGAILATAHLGFYDLGVAWIGAMGWPFTTVAEVLKPRALFEWFAGIRERNGMRVIPASPGSAARARLTELVKAGEGVAILSDRDVSRRGIWVELFGEPTTIPAGPALLAVRTRAPLLTGAIFKEGRRFRVIFEPAPYELTGNAASDIESVAEVIARGIERLVRVAPEQWHLFNPNWPSDEPPGLPPRGRIERGPPTGETAEGGG